MRAALFLSLAARAKTRIDIDSFYRALPPMGRIAGRTIFQTYFLWLRQIMDWAEMLRLLLR
jgi:hypothetical protein